MRLDFGVLLILILIWPASMQTAFGQDRGPVIIEITAADCRALVTHQTAPDVAYQPGVDVRGRPVAPADLPGGVVIEPPRTFIIPIEIDLVERFGLLSTVPGFEADALVGTVLYDDGQLFFNGQPLIDPMQTAIAEACRQLIR